MKTRIFYVMMLMFTVVMSSMLTGCSKDDKEKEDPSPIDSYVGTYKGKETFTNNGKTESRDVTIVVSKSGVESNSLILSGPFYAKNQIVQASLTGTSAFSFMYTMIDNGVSVTVTGYNGSFGQNRIRYSYSAQDYVSIEFEGTKM